MTHPRANTPIEMLEESLNEILKIVSYSVYTHKDSTEFDDYLTGIYGFPASILMLSLVDTLGGYYENNDSLEIEVDGKLRQITESNKSHYYILNSHLFNANLTEELISIIYDCRNSLLHNNVLTKNVLLINSDREPFIEKVLKDSNIVVEIRLQSFLNACYSAVDTFFNSPPDIKSDLKHRTSFFDKKLCPEKGLNKATDIDDIQTT